MKTQQLTPYKLFMCDAAGVDDRVFNGFNTRNLFTGRGGPDELCSPFNF